MRYKENIVTVDKIVELEAWVYQVVFTGVNGQ